MARRSAEGSRGGVARARCSRRVGRGATRCAGGAGAEARRPM
jgi:hypothetical protein